MFTVIYKTTLMLIHMLILSQKCIFQAYLTRKTLCFVICGMDVEHNVPLHKIGPHINTKCCKTGGMEVNKWYSSIHTSVGCAMFQAVCHWLLTVEVHVQSQASPCEICGGQICTGTWFPPSISVVPCQYHSISAPYSYIQCYIILPTECP